MKDQDETTNGPEKDRNESGEKPEGIVARLKRLYEERPGTFAVGVIGVSALLFLLGGVVSGDLDLAGAYVGQLP